MSAPLLQSGEQRSTYNNVTSVVVNKPAGVAVGDLLLVEISDNNATAGWSSPGWTAGPSFDRIFSFWRIADGSEGASFTFTFSGSGRVGAMICHRITGAHQTAPIDVSSGVVVASGAANPISLPSITTTGPDRLLLAVFYSKTATVGTSFSTPTGMAAAYAYQAASSAFGQASAFTESFATAGATGVRDSNSSATNYARVAFLLAIAPPSANPTTGQTWPHGKKGTSPTTGQLFPRGVIL